MRTLLFLLCLIAVPIQWSGEAKIQGSDDDADRAEKELLSDQSDAAAYRLTRARTPPTAADDAIAKTYLDIARDLYLAGTTQAAPGESARVSRIRQGATFTQEWWWDQLFSSILERAAEVAERGFEAAPYSTHAGDLLAIRVMAQAANGDLPQLRKTLHRLWFYLPDYAGIADIFRATLAAAERLQNFSAAIDLEAETPAAVVRLDSNVRNENLDRIFRFLLRFGDRVEIAPKAALGLARSQLLSPMRNELYAARRAYEDFLSDYPRSPLVFTALCELTLSHLKQYRGDDYDIGALISGNLQIDQAEQETAGDPARVALVKQYRARIRGWLQDRDLRVARWYRSKQMPNGLIATPHGLDNWLDGARLYYREAIRRDPTSRQGLVAEREIAALPAPTTARPLAE